MAGKRQVSLLYNERGVAGVFGQKLCFTAVGPFWRGHTAGALPTQPCRGRDDKLQHGRQINSGPAKTSDAPTTFDLGKLFAGITGDSKCKLSDQSEIYHPV